MPGTWRDRLSEFESEKERWFRERRQQAAVALGGLGRPAEARHAPVQTPQVHQGLQPTVGRSAREAALQVDTAARGAANVLTFGGADRLAAGLDALAERGGLARWRQRYESNLSEQEARNRYDTVRRPAGLGVGRLAGTVLGVAAVGPMEGALAALPRMAGSAARTGRETAAMLGAGGLMGAGAQAASDIATGRRSTWRDQVGAAAGGVATTAALPLGPARAGAIGGWTTAAAQDLMNGRPISLERAGQSAIIGNVLGGGAGIVGRQSSNALSPKAKGKLGEVLGDIRGKANLQPRDWSPKTREYLSDGKAYWYPDGRSGSIRFEDKFGVGARLSKNQILAQSELGSNFKLYHFLPSDVGKIFGAPTAAAAPHVINDRNSRK